ncbi:hypothetical protein ACLEED_01165 [Lonsdalea quercina]|uniref:hypothetical protein n=1 Tax=Lonsdalea quercina TaxID=71657 RepID=UPI003975821B
MENAKAIISSRPIFISRPGIASSLGAFIAGLLILCGALLFAKSEVPDIYRDYIINKSPLVIENSDISNGECRMKYSITFCSADVKYKYKNENHASKINILFLDLSRGNYKTDVVISSEHPELATLTLGLDKLNNRIIAAGGLIGALLILAALSLINSVKFFRAGRRAKCLSELTLVPVETDEIRKLLFIRVLPYTYIGEDKKKIKLASLLKRNEQPIYLDDSKKRAWAVLLKEANIPVLLDDRLMRLELSDEERESLRAAFAG